MVAGRRLVDRRRVRTEVAADTTGSYAGAGRDPAARDSASDRGAACSDATGRNASAGRGHAACRCARSRWRASRWTSRWPAASAA